MFMQRINYDYPVLDRRLDFNQEQLTSIELVAKAVQKVNEMIDFINGVDALVEGKENSSSISTNRKLSKTGNFSGQLLGRNVANVLTSIDDAGSKITYLANQFANGQTGFVVDGGYFEETGIKKNYDGGVF